MTTRNGVTLHKRSAVQGKVPLTTDLELGQLGLNTFDGKIYLKKDDGAEEVVQVGADKVEWKGVWSETEYNKNDLVKDGVWTMIANKTTTDRAAPQPIGGQEWGIAPEAAFGQDQYTGIVTVSQEYTVNTGGWIQAIQVRMPGWTLSSTIVKIALIVGSEVTIVNDPLLSTDDEWVTLGVGETVLPSGSVVTVVMEMYHQNDASSINGEWATVIDTFDPEISGTMNISSTTADGTMKIDHRELDGTVHTTELRGVAVGSIITLAETSASARSSTLITTSVDTSNTSSFSTYTFDLVSLGSSGGVRDGRNTTLQIDIPIVEATDYSVLTDGYLTNPSWATVVAALKTGGITQPDTKDAYGINLLFQPGQLSDDWDLVASSAVSGASGGGEGGGIGEAPENGTPYARQDKLWVGAASSAQGALADSALQNVAEDTSPELGGNLDLKGSSIVDTDGFIHLDNTTKVKGPIGAPATGLFVEVASSGNEASISLANESQESKTGITYKEDIDKIELYSGSANPVKLFNFEWPLGDGSSGQVMSTDGSRNLIFVDNGMSTLVEDTTPQLGGDLELGDQTTSTGHRIQNSDVGGRITLDHGPNDRIQIVNPDDRAATDGRLYVYGNESAATNFFAGWTSSYAAQGGVQLNADTIGEENLSVWTDGAGGIALSSSKLTLGAANHIWPATDGTNGQAIITDGSGNLSWASGGNWVGTATSDLDLNGNSITDGTGHVRLATAKNLELYIDQFDQARVQFKNNFDPSQQAEMSLREHVCEFATDNVAFRIDVYGIANGGIEIGKQSNAPIDLNYARWPNAEGGAGEVLTTDGAGTLTWETLGAGVSSLNDLSDVTISTPSTQSFLYYNGANWEDQLITLGTNTNGNYVESIGAGTGISVDDSGSEGGTPTVTNTDRGSSQNIFKNFAVSGQSTIAADTNSDTITFVAGTGITLTTNASTDALTITSDGGGGGFPTGYSSNGITVEPNASGSQAISLGQGATGSGHNTVSFGTNAQAGQNDGIAIGNNAQANTGASDENAISIGANTQGSNRTVAIGVLANAGGQGAIALGDSTNASGDNAVAIGNDTTTNGNSGVAIGRFASAGEESLALGPGAVSPGTNGAGIAIGQGTTIIANAGDGSFSTSGIAIGNNAQADGGSLAIGGGADARTTSGICVGSSTIESAAWNTLVFGHYATVEGSAGGSIILGIGHGNITTPTVRAGDGFGGNYFDYELNAGKFRLVSGSAQYIVPGYSDGTTNNGEEGSLIYDTTNKVLKVHDGSDWQDSTPVSSATLFGGFKHTFVGGVLNLITV